MEALRNTEVALVNELKFDTQKYHWRQKWPLKNTTTPRHFDIKEPSGQGIANYSEYGKIMPWNQPVRY